jgi:hypothetical protein
MCTGFILIYRLQFFCEALQLHFYVGYIFHSPFLMGRFNVLSYSLLQTPSEEGKFWRVLRTHPVQNPSSARNNDDGDYVGFFTVSVCQAPCNFIRQ